MHEMHQRLQGIKSKRRSRKIFGAAFMLRSWNPLYMHQVIISQDGTGFAQHPQRTRQQLSNLVKSEVGYPGVGVIALHKKDRGEKVVVTGVQGGGDILGLIPVKKLAFFREGMRRQVVLTVLSRLMAVPGEFRVAFRF